MTIFVTFEDSSDEQNDENLYLVDVGFGRACIPQPMPLRELFVKSRAHEPLQELGLR